MATKLEKMVEDSQKRIAKYNKGIERYSSLLQKNLVKFGLSEEDIIPHPLGGYTLRDNVRNWDAIDAIVGNYEYLIENKRNLEREQKALKELEDKLSEQNKQQNDTESYVKYFDGVLSDFKKDHLHKCDVAYSEHWKKINRKDLTKVTNRRDRAKKVVFYFEQSRAYSRIGMAKVSKMKNIAKTICDNCNAILCDKALRMSHDEYVADELKNDKSAWMYGLRKLADRVMGLGVCNLEDMELVNVNYEGEIEVLLKWCGRYIHIRGILCAEYSDYVCPHVRYIATIRM